MLTSNICSGETIRTILEELHFPKCSRLGKGSVFSFSSDVDTLFKNICARSIRCQQVAEDSEIKEESEYGKIELSLSKSLSAKRQILIDDLNYQEDLDEYPEILSTATFLTDMTILSLPISERNEVLNSDESLWKLLGAGYVLASKFYYVGEDIWQIDIIETLNFSFEPQLKSDKEFTAKTLELTDLILTQGQSTRDCGPVTFALISATILATSFPITFSENRKITAFVDLIDYYCRYMSYMPIIPRRKTITSPVIIGATIACLCFRAIDNEDGREVKTILPKDNNSSDFSFSASMAFYLDDITGEDVEQCATKLLIPFRERSGPPSHLNEYWFTDDYDPFTL